MALDFKVSRLQRRRKLDHAFQRLTLGSVIIALICLGFFLSKIFADGFPYLTWKFLSSFASRKPEEAGILASLAGTFWLMILTGIFSIPFGIGSAVFIQEYLPNRSRWKEMLILNLANLSGLPSIIYGLLGLTLFVRIFGFGGSLIAGSLTMSLLILPTIVITSIEAIKAVPRALREAAFALGSRKWQVVWYHVLPSALPGILTGLILASSRAIGEAAPLIIVGGVGFIAFTPQSIFDDFTVLPLQIFNWASRPQESFHNLAAAGIVVLMILLLAFNLASILLRYHYGKKYKY